MFELTDEQARQLAAQEFDYQMPPAPPKPPKPKRPHPLERPVYFQPPESDTLTRHRYRIKTRVAKTDRYGED